jgi:hypothetical protein
VSRKRLIVCVPLGDMVNPKFFQGWTHLKLAGIKVVTSNGMYITQAHNYLVQEALKSSHWDRLVFIETDHLLPPNALERISYYEQPIVSASYFLREPPHQLCAYLPQPKFENDADVWKGQWDGSQCTWATPSRVLEFLSRNQLFRVLAVGMGCTSIDREVLESWPQDELWFQSPMEVKEGQNPREASLITDDFHFCRRAAQLGHEIHVDGGMMTPHIGTRLVGPDTMLRYYEDEARTAGLIQDDKDEAAKARLQLMDYLRSTVNKASNNAEASYHEV